MAVMLTFSVWTGGQNPTRPSETSSFPGISSWPGRVVWPGQDERMGLDPRVQAT
jgi:hypothetical protein